MMFGQLIRWVKARFDVYSTPKSSFIDQELKGGIDVLVSQGWVEAASFVFQKNGYEIVFDTSTYVELYQLKSGQRISESRVCCADDMARFLRQNGV